MLPTLAAICVAVLFIPCAVCFQLRIYANDACDSSALHNQEPLGALQSSLIYPVADSGLDFTDGCQSVKTFGTWTYENGDSLRDGAASMSGSPIIPEVRSKDRVEAYATEDCGGPIVASLGIKDDCATTNGERIRSILVKRDLSWLWAWHTYGYKHIAPDPSEAKTMASQSKHGQISVWGDTVVKLWQKCDSYTAVVPLEIWDGEVYLKNDEPCPGRDKDKPGPGIDLFVSKSFCENGVYGRIYREFCEEKGYVAPCKGSWVVDEQGIGSCKEAQN